MKKFLALFLTAGFLQLSAGEIVQLKQSNFEQVVDAQSLVVVDVYADWCGPCRRFAPIFEKASSQFSKYKFVKLNGDEEYELATHFRITAFPTVIYLKNGKEVGRHIGLMDKAQFASELKMYLGE
ncbi:MAG: thioredoxin [Verrucomicrobia bacterium]|nr:thioredoxin [Verrucomicrobiota bacterium]